MIITGFPIKAKLTKEGGISLEQLIKDMKVPLSFLLINNTRLFKKIILNVTAIGSTLSEREMKLNI